MKPANILHLGVKELISLWHDPVMIIFILYAFSLGVYSGAKGIATELKNAPVAIVDEDRSALSQRLAGAIFPPQFKTPDMIGLDEVDPGMDSGKYTFVLDIPPRFGADVRAGKDPKIQLNIDANRMSQAFTGASYLQAIAAEEVRAYLRGHRTEAAPAASLVLSYKFNPTLTSVWFGSVVELINQITLLAVILTGAALIREREHGTLEHLLVMPLTPAEIMLSKVWANGLVVLAAAGLSVWLVIKGALAMPIAGSIALFLAGTALHLFSVTALGILLGTLARTMPQMGLLLMLVILPLQMLSGGSTPFESMPRAIQAVMHAAPTMHYVKFAQAILCRGAGLDVVWPGFVAEVILGALFFLIALRLFRRSLAAAV